MRQLIVDNYKGQYTVKGSRHEESYSLKTLALKTHGLINFDDLVFFSQAEAIKYATKIAQRINLIDGTNEIYVLIKKPFRYDTIVINSKDSNTNPIDLDPVPNNEPNNWTTLKMEA